MNETFDETVAPTDEQSSLQRVLGALRSEREQHKAANRKVRELEQALGDAETQEKLRAAQARASVLEKSTLELHVRNAAKAAGIHTCAERDAVRTALDEFQIADDGTVTRKDGTGADLTAWFAEQREISPHWFPATGGRIGSAAFQPACERLRPLLPDEIGI